MIRRTTRNTQPNRSMTMSRKTTMFRQGDVLVIHLKSEIPTVTAEAVPAENGRTVLAHGEVTGHAHALDAATTMLYGPSDDLLKTLGLAGNPRDRVMVAMVDTPLQHEEHSAFVIPAGVSIVRKQLHYTPAAIQNVLD